MSETATVPESVDLLDFLRARYEAATDQHDDLLASTSLVDAVRSTVQLAWAPHPVNVQVVYGTGGSGHHTLLWLLDGLDDVATINDPYAPSLREVGQSGVVGSLEVWERDMEAWDAAANDAERTFLRDLLLYRVLRMARVDLYSADDVVTTDKALNAYPDGFLAAVGDLWCELKFAADADPEGVSALFALVAHPQVHARVGQGVMSRRSVASGSRAPGEGVRQAVGGVESVVSGAWR